MLVPRRPEQRAGRAQAFQQEWEFITRRHATRAVVCQRDGVGARGRERARGFAPDTPLDAKSRGGEETPPKLQSKTRLPGAGFVCSGWGA